MMTASYARVIDLDDFDPDKIAKAYPTFKPHIAAKFPNIRRFLLGRGLEDGDIDGLIWLNILKYADRWDSTKSNPKTYLFLIVRTVLLNQWKKYRTKLSRAVSEETTLSAINIEIDCLNGMGVEDEGLIETKDRLLDRLALDLNQIHPRKRLVVQRFFGVGAPATSQKELADELGVSRQRVHQLLLAGIKELRIKEANREFARERRRTGQGDLVGPQSPSGLFSDT